MEILAVCKILLNVVMAPGVNFGFGPPMAPGIQIQQF